MALRDAGWIQLFAESNQEAADLHVIAFRLAETLSVPVMVCVDGFILTHAFEPVELPVQSAVDAFLPRFQPREVLDPAEPVTIGALVGPEAFTEVKVLAHERLLRAIDRIPAIAREFATSFGRPSGGLVRGYRVEDAETVVVALGSVNGTIQEVVDAMRNEGQRVGSLGICTFRPFPFAAVREALLDARRIVVVEKNLAVGMGGVLAADVRESLRGDGPAVHTVIAGLGGRAITRAALRKMLDELAGGTLSSLSFLELDRPALDRARERELQP
jgi:pyruvate ferredoxin oxidoreductase alpha subunit